MFQTSLEDEYRALIEELGFGRDDVLALLDNAIDSSWADEATKKWLRQELTRSTSG